MKNFAKRFMQLDTAVAVMIGAFANTFQNNGGRLEAPDAERRWLRLRLWSGWREGVILLCFILCTSILLGSSGFRTPRYSSEVSLSQAKSFAKSVVNGLFRPKTFHWSTDV